MRKNFLRRIELFTQWRMYAMNQQMIKMDIRGMQNLSLSLSRGLSRYSYIDLLR